ncbi:MAG: HAMP domain-containing histidine kinase [Lachnospiraceae bacterium]|nr:HAMP domain-containing histidine kinase [Lachnospiraceae bacterium]
MNLFPVVLLLLCILCGMTAALGLAVWRLRYQEQSMDRAARQIAEYILNQQKGGIECNREGAMYRLFHEVNVLVAIADAHGDSERRAREFLRDIISDISHQLRTPVAALNIYNGILRQEAADAATVLEFADRSEKELDRIQSLVESLLKMARLDAGTITLEQSQENISDLLEYIRRQYSFRAGQEGKELILEGEEQAVLSCDRVWLSEAIGNLVKNALDHTDQGDCILIRWHQSPYLTQITVEDTGNGIHPEDLYHIFKRFYRSRFSKDTQGTGLGLPLAKLIIEAHQGSIEVWSELGRGTIFTISFLHQADAGCFLPCKTGQEDGPCEW